MLEHNASQFLSHFNTTQHRDYGNGVKITEDILCTGENFLSNSIRIYDVVFAKNIKFAGIKTCQWIKFENCTFEGDFEFYAVELTENNSLYSTDIVIENDCNIRTLNINNCIFPGGLKILNSSINKLNIRHIKINYNSFSLENVNIVEDIECENFICVENKGNKENKSKVSFNIKESTINGQPRFCGLQVESFSLIKSTFGGDIFIQSLETQSVVFNDNVFNDDVCISNIKNEGYFVTNGDIFKKNLEIKCSEDYFQKIYRISRVQIGGVMQVTNGSERLKEVTINSSLINNGTIIFRNCILDHLAIDGDNHKLNMIFKQIIFQKIELKDFTNYGNLTFSSSKGEENNSMLSIISTNLGKTQFFDVNLDSFNVILIQNSAISEIIISNVNWFKSEKLNKNKEASEKQNKEASLEKLNNRREIYRQLKQATEKQGDRIQSLTFQAEEMKVYKEIVKQKHKRTHSDRLILWLSSTNDYGVNWVKPLWIILLLTIFIFYPLLIILVSNKLTFYPATKFEDVERTFKEFYHYIQILPQLFNPTRTLDKLFSEKLGFWTHTIDIFHRILFAFFTFQIISAFRKYVK